MNIKALAALLMLSVLLCIQVSAQGVAKPNANQISVTITGIHKSDSYLLPQHATITQALLAAGGIADIQKVRLVRRSCLVLIVNLKKIMTHPDLDVILQDKDVVQIPESVF